MKQRLLKSRSGKNYDAECESQSLGTWTLLKRTFVFFWKKVRVGTAESIINEAKHRNKMTGSSNSSIDSVGMSRSKKAQEVKERLEKA
tara:strand:+ start:213 stop:476 length:264 start_codon:yes stop_codon:yes gene_type:complete